MFPLSSWGMVSPFQIRLGRRYGLSPGKGTKIEGTLYRVVPWFPRLGPASLGSAGPGTGVGAGTREGTMDPIEDQHRDCVN